MQNLPFLTHFLTPTGESPSRREEAGKRGRIEDLAGKEVEFGNTLMICESAHGYILDWKLYREQAPSESWNGRRTWRSLRRSWPPAPTGASPQKKPAEC
jgi:hypothetical protein